jgi:hypothetical protein
MLLTQSRELAFFLTKTLPLSVSFDLETTGSKPVLIHVGLFLCGSHWQKVLIRKDPTDKALSLFSQKEKA